MIFMIISACGFGLVSANPEYYLQAEKSEETTTATNWDSQDETQALESDASTLREEHDNTSNPNPIPGTEQDTVNEETDETPEEDEQDQKGNR